VIALAILALLLEMNRFLPGTWSGGDRGGARQVSSSGADTRTGVAEQDIPDTPEDAAVVKPPDARSPEWPPKLGLLIELRGVAGHLETDWRLGVGDGGTESDRPDEEGLVRSRDRRLHQQGFRIRTGGRLIRHRHGVDDPATRWVVAVPRAALPQQRAPAPLRLTVVDHETGKPIPGAEVMQQGTAEPSTARTDAAGRLNVRGRERAGLLTLKVSAPSHETRTVVLSTRDAEPAIVRMDRWVDLRLGITATGGSPVVVSAGYVLHADGSILARFKGDTPALRLREKDLQGAWIELHVIVDPERRTVFPFRTRLVRTSTKVTVPENRILEVNVRDPEGNPVINARIKTRFSPRSSSEEGVYRGESPLAQADSTRTDGAGRAYVAVPTALPYTVMVEAPQAAPLVRRFQAGDGNTPLEVIAEQGLQVPVRVRGSDGRVLRGATIVARASVAGLRIAAHAMTDTEGRADLGPLGEGPIEIFAWAPGHGWAAVVETAAEVMGTVELRLPPGARLTLVVEDPFGVALVGVHAEVTPADGGRPLVSPPRDVTWRSDRTGHLYIPDLPDRLYDVTLTLPGYGLEKLTNVRPGGSTYFATLVRNQ